MVHKWLSSYLIGRKQSVRSCGYTSYQYESLSGVPEGSNLGLLLFLIFINDLSAELVICKVLLFADDVKLYYVISSNSDSELLQADLSRLEAWSLRNGLPLNPGKCKVISFSQGVCKFSQP